MDRMRGHMVVAVLAVAFLVPGALPAEDFKIDPAHSSANFSVKHLMISSVKGRFADISGVIHLDENDISKSSVTAVIKATSINTDNERRDNHLRSGDFFDVAKYPEIRFQSTSVEKRGEQYVAIGNLTIKDVTKQIELPFTFATADANGKKRMGVEASTKINRFEYHVEYDKTGASVGKEVKIELNLEAAGESATAAGAGK